MPEDIAVQSMCEVVSATSTPVNRFLIKLPTSTKTPIVHAMVEYLIDVFYTRYADAQKLSLVELIAVIDEHIDNPYLNRGTITFELPGHSNNEHPDEHSTNLIKHAGLEISRHQKPGHRSGNPSYILRIDAEFVIANTANYELAGLTLQEHPIPESIMNAIVDRYNANKIDSRNPPLTLRQIIDVQIGDIEMPDLVINSILFVNKNDYTLGCWYDMETSWELWSNMRARLLSRYS